MWPEGDNLFPDLQIAIFSFEPRRGPLELPASIVFQQGAQTSCQLIFFYSRPPSAWVNSIINQLRGVSFYLQTLIPCVSILFENKTEVGCKITWTFSPHELFNSLSPPIAAFLLCPLGHKHDKSALHAAELSRQLFGGCSFTVLCNTNKKPSHRQSAFCVTRLWE